MTQVAKEGDFIIHKLTTILSNGKHGVRTFDTNVLREAKATIISLQSQLKQFREAKKSINDLQLHLDQVQEAARWRESA